MQTILSRMKQLVTDSKANGTLSYVSLVEVVHPEIGLYENFSLSSLPSIYLTPLSHSEQWIANGRKELTHQVAAYLMMQYRTRELSIMGDATRGTQGKGILGFVSDFFTAFRATRLQLNGDIYLSKPLEFVRTRYIIEKSEDAFLLVAEVMMQCNRILSVNPLPGEV